MKNLKEAFAETDLAEHCEDIESALSYYDGSSDADEFIDWYRETYVDHAEIICYHNAIKYLAENDPSFMESMGLAAEYGYSLDKVNSELLATLLLQQELNNELEGLRDDLQEYFETIENESEGLIS